MSGLQQRLRRFADEPWAPGLVLGVGAFLVAAFAARHGTRVTTFALDESVIKQSAVNYTHGLPGSVEHDLAARGPSRLYSFVQSFVFRIWSGDEAVRHAKELNAFMFASAAIPVWVLAKRMLKSRWAAVAAGLLAVACPWLSLSTTIYTENLSYPLFAWVLVAMAWSLDRPSWRRDLMVVALSGASLVTRVQFWTLLVWWPVVIVTLDLLESKDKGTVPERAIASAKRVVRAHPATFAVVALGALYVAYLSLNNTLKAKFNSNLGTYSEIGHRSRLPTDYFTALFAEVVHFAAALAVLPVLAAAVFWVRSLIDRSDPARWRIVFMLVVVGAGTTLATLFAQGGYAGSATEERYYMYLVPLAWIGAFGLLQLRAIKTAWLVSAAGVLLLLFATVPIATPLTTEYAFLAPGGASTGRLVSALGDRIGGMTERDLLTWLAFLLCAVAIWVWVKRPGWRGAWIAAPALFQVVLTFYVFGAIEGDAKGIPSRTGGDFAKLAFIDRNVPGDAPVTWLDAQRKPYDLSAEARQRFVLFWNQKISGVADDFALKIRPVSYPLSSVPLMPLTVDPATGLIDSRLPLTRVAAPVDSPFLQLASKRVVARSEGGDIALIEPEQPARAIWRASGLVATGTINRTPARLRAWGPGRIQVSLRFAPAPAGDLGVPGAPTAALLDVAGASRTIALDGGRSRTVTVDGCARGDAPLAGSVRALRGTPQLVSVRVRRAGRC